MSAADGPRTSRLPRALRPLGFGQFRLLATAVTMSLFGAGVWLVALVWKVIELGGGPVDLSIVATAASLGLLGAVLIGGVVADRVPQRRILIGTEAAKTLTIGVAAVLGLTGGLELWHLAAVSLVLGVADGFFYPAYSAWLPSILPADQLLAANGIEGVLRPTIMQAAGPAAASAMIALLSPDAAFLLVAVSQAFAVVVLFGMHTTPVRRVADAEQRSRLRGVIADLRGGFGYMRRTPWFLATLIFAVALVLVIMGPIEVLLPFAVRDQTGGGAGAFALTLAAFGIGGAVGSMVTASFRLPRRYLTIMNLLWGAGCIPLAIIGFTDQLWLMVAALLVVGYTFGCGQVLWGTLLQRRVPPELLGRVSSLDFFVSLALMPVSMALAGPVGEAVGIPLVFLVAGLAPPLFAVAAILIWRLPQDEIAHPLDTAEGQQSQAAEGTRTSGTAEPEPTG
ncbi:MFS transporter [Lysobacter korlensis]|uniref:MFS transporter n=1 Tax=Lysobacter korlensis TaxID=553636 RepID=A0ABV6RNA7_9GAMM